MCAMHSSSSPSSSSSLLLGCSLFVERILVGCYLFSWCATEWGLCFLGCWVFEWRAAMCFGGFSFSCCESRVNGFWVSVSWVLQAAAETTTTTTLPSMSAPRY